MNEREAFQLKIQDKIKFILVAVGVCTVTLAVFALFDFLPERPASDEAQTDETMIVKDSHDDTFVDADPYPVLVRIDALDKEITVLNPASTDVATLDNALLSGVVRHPESADFAQTGTMFLLGHSSYLPHVINKNFQAFNGIQNLTWGDTIRVQSSDVEYIYSVDRVYEAKASTAEVPLQFDVAKLVLATCNSFGTKDDRYIVEASLVAKRAL